MFLIISSVTSNISIYFPNAKHRFSPRGPQSHRAKRPAAKPLRYPFPNRLLHLENEKIGGSNSARPPHSPGRAPVTSARDKILSGQSQSAVRNRGSRENGNSSVRSPGWGPGVGQPTEAPRMASPRSHARCRTLGSRRAIGGCRF